MNSYQNNAEVHETRIDKYMTPNYCKIHYQAIGKKAYDIKPFIEVFEKYTNSFLSSHNSENTNHNIQLKISVI